MWRTILYNFVREKYAIFGGPNIVQLCNGKICNIQTTKYCTTLQGKNMQYLEDHFVQLCNGKICNIWRTILYNFVTEKCPIFGQPNIVQLCNRKICNIRMTEYLIITL